MLSHEFIALSKDNIPDCISYGLINQFNFVAIQDKVVLENIEVFLAGFNSYWDCFDNPNKGLNYYGITIIPPSELPYFICALNQLKEKYDVNDLMLLFGSAVSSNKWIIHFGV